MITEQVISLVFAIVVGVALGALYFGGLWLTVRHLPTMRHPAIWMTASLVMRMAVILTVLYFLSDGHWGKLLAGVAGMLVVRIILLHRVRVETKKDILAREAAP